VEIEVVPGISAFQKAASLLGAPIGHVYLYHLPLRPDDSLATDRKTHTGRRYRRLRDSHLQSEKQGRYWQLHRLKELFLEERAPETPVGYVRQAGREEQVVNLTTLAEFDPEQV